MKTIVLFTIHIKLFLRFSWYKNHKLFIIGSLLRNTPKSLNTKYDEYTDNPYVSNLEIWIRGREEREKQKLTQTDSVGPNGSSKKLHLKAVAWNMNLLWKEQEANVHLEIYVPSYLTFEKDKQSYTVWLREGIRWYKISHSSYQRYRRGMESPGEIFLAVSPYLFKGKYTVIHFPLLFYLGCQANLTQIHQSKKLMLKAEDPNVILDVTYSLWTSPSSLIHL